MMMAGWLSLCEPAFCEAVLERGRIQVLEAGDPLFHAGDPATGIFGLRSGALAMSFLGPEFGPSVSHIVLPGAWFGEAAYVRMANITGVRATRPSRAVILPMRDIEALVAEEPRRWIGFATLAVLNGQLAMGAAYDLMLRDPLQRCAATLLRLAGLRHGPPLTTGEVELDITQSDFAHMTNLSRNSVGAILRVLRERQCIDVDYRQLLITDPAQLKSLLVTES
jgi:CRP/FNR family cyclic AMP-dependent transcriptional regulator